MNDNFKKILDLLEKINTKQSIIPISDLQKEYNRLKDLTWLDNDTSKHITLLKDSSSIENIMEQVCYFKVNLSTYVWHIENIRDTIERFIRNDKK
jgi:hypothetical protein